MHNHILWVYDLQSLSVHNLEPINMLMHKLLVCLLNHVHTLLVTGDKFLECVTIKRRKTTCRRRGQSVRKETRRSSVDHYTLI